MIVIIMMAILIYALMYHFLLLIVVSDVPILVFSLLMHARYLLILFVFSFDSSVQFVLLADSVLDDEGVSVHVERKNRCHTENYFSYDVDLTMMLSW